MNNENIINRLCFIFGLVITMVVYLSFFFYIRSIFEKFPATILYVLLILSFFVYLLMFSAQIRIGIYDPGKYPLFQKIERKDLEETYSEKDMSCVFVVNRTNMEELLGKEVTYPNGKKIALKYCKTCNIFRPPKTSHCKQCDRCIDSFDHHCPFFGNCIGKKNLEDFFLFLFYTIFLCFICLFSFLYLFSIPTWSISYSFLYSKIALCIFSSYILLILILIFILFIRQAIFLSNNTTTAESIKLKRNIEDNCFYFPEELRFKRNIFSYIFFTSKF